MAVSYVSAGSISGNNVTSVNVPGRAGTQVNDVILLFTVAYTGAATITRPTGFTGLDENIGGGQSTNHKASGCYKLAVAGDDIASFTWSYSGLSYVDAIIYVLRGLDTTTPVLNHSVIHNAGSYVTSLPAPALTITNTTDATVYCYSGITSTASGTNPTTLPGTLSNNFTANASFLGDAFGVGWGINVSAPGAATATTGVDFIDFGVDLLAAGGAFLAPKALITDQAITRSASW
jgi:hypothetical protein